MFLGLHGNATANDDCCGDCSSYPRYYPEITYYSPLTTSPLEFTIRDRSTITRPLRSMGFTTDITHRIHLTTGARRRTAISFEALTDEDGRNIQIEEDAQR
jgi:hypothetical protein